MDSSLQSIFNLYVLSTGRRMFALRQVKSIASELEQKGLVALINRAIDHESKTLKLEAGWQATGYDSDPQRVKKIDGKVDRTLSAIRDVASAQAMTAEPGETLYEMLHEFLGTIFPLGVNAVSSMPYVEELAAVETILKQLRGPFERHVKELGLSRLVDSLAELTVEYRAAQEEKPKSDMSYGDVRSARAIGQEYLLQAVAVIAGTYYGSTGEHAKARSRLLAPILEQNEAVRLSLKGRKPLEDVDPTTGDPQPIDPRSLPQPPATVRDTDDN